LVSDRKITFPHAIARLLAFLPEHSDCIAAMGYNLGFADRQDTIDINRIMFFTPTIGEDDPLQRHYHLMRRYQSWAFGLFRTSALAAAIEQAQGVSGAIFQEIMLMNALALQGKMARLPVVLSLQTEEHSFHAPRQNNPLYWFLDDARSFVLHHARYRRALIRFIRSRGIMPASGSSLDQLVDMIHAVWLHFSFDYGKLNHTARLLLGDPLQPLPGPHRPIPRRELEEGDVVMEGCRQYVWRREVLGAEPRNEIQISADEMDRVVQSLDVYFGARSDNRAIASAADGRQPADGQLLSEQ
jgi:hypothetical protein